MKLLLKTAVVALSAMLFSCSGGGEDLQGHWVSEAYQCPFGNFHTEEVRITVNDGFLTATKITGDDCVPAGQVSFSGHYEPGEISKMVCVTGVPENPASSTEDGTLVVNKDGTIAACEMRFRRKQ